MSRYNPHHPSSNQVFHAAEFWKNKCLLEDGSAFSTGEIWTYAHTQELVTHFVLQPDEGEGHFLEKLKTQLANSSSGAKRLMAELLWVYCLFPSNFGPEAKRRLVLPVWSWSGATLDPATPLLSDDTLGGLGSGGPGILNHRWREIRFLVNFAARVKQLSPHERTSLLHDPWAFNDFVDSTPDQGRRQLKLILPHLVFPDTFERIATTSAVHAILQRLGNTSRSDINAMDKRAQDEALVRIRERLEADAGESIDFYEGPISVRWNQDGVAAPETNAAPAQVAAGASPPLNQILFGPPGTGKPFRTIDKALAIVDPAFYAENQSDRSLLHEHFIKLVEVGQIALVTFHQSMSYEDFVEGIRASTDKDGQLSYFVEDGVLKRMARPSTSIRVGQTFSREYRVLRSTTEILWLQKPNRASLPLAWDMLHELTEHVRSGTISINDLREGTWFERLEDSRLEKYIVNGYKNVIPEIISFMITAADSNQSAGLKKVLIIDEINRGNISKIFGELITLIEPDKRLGNDEALSVTLPYSKEQFGLPKSLHIIGTMNTADRSLSALDLALRRRFVFEEMEPDPGVLAEIEIEGVNIGQLLTALNARIEVLLDREHRLGHAYFTHLDSSPTLSALAAVFQTRIIPLLQEYFFDDWKRIALVLNDGYKPVENRVLLEKDRNINLLFGTDVEIPDRPSWTVNWDALNRAATYEGMLLP